MHARYELCYSYAIAIAMLAMSDAIAMLAMSHAIAMLAML